MKPVMNHPLLKYIIKFLLSIIGLCVVSIFIWHRFLRERLPREIPFDLSLIKFILLLYICLVYFSLVILIIVNYQSNSKILNSIVTFIYLPVTTLDETIKTGKILEPICRRILFFVTSLLKKFHPLRFKSYYFVLAFYAFFQIFPRVILVTTLCIDVFYFHYLNYIYKAIPLYLLIFLGKYIKYSLKYAREQYTLYLEEVNDGILTSYTDEIFAREHPGCLSLQPVRKFIFEQTLAVVYDKKEYTYSPMPTDQYIRDFCERNLLVGRLYQEGARKLNSEIKPYLDLVVQAAIFVEEYEFAPETRIVRRIRAFIFSLYFLCWSYILYISVKTANLSETIILVNKFEKVLELFWIKSKEIIEPFSDLSFTYDGNYLNLSYFAKYFEYMCYIRDLEEPFSGILLFLQ